MATERGGRWEARPMVAGLIRVLVVVVPAVAGALASWEVSRLWEQPEEFWPTVFWFLTLVAVAVAVVLVVQRFARRFLPLAWLFSLTMAFPDRTPSRMVTARRAASRRSRRKALDRLKDDGLGRDAGEASEAALVLVAALGVHDRRTRGHSERVRTLADLLAEEAGLSDEERDKLRWGALLHDIGKLAVPGAILNKPDRPNEEEWATLQRHPEEGAHLVEPLVTWLGPWSDAVGHHHEKWDGTGYPHGLTGEDISLGARILAIADAYEVMTASRPYKSPQRPDVARKELVASAGAHFDPVLVRHFLAVSLGKLWWLIGGSAVLSLVPWLAGLWTAPAGAAIRRTGSGPATAAAAVGVLALAGVVAPAATPLRSDPAPVEVAVPGAAPSPTPALDPGAVTPVSSLALAPPAPVTPTPGPRATLPVVVPPPEGSNPESTSPPAAVPPPADPSAPAPADDPPAPSAPPPPASPLFSARGQMLLPNLLGLTLGQMQAGCGQPPSSGVDAVVFDLPPEARVAGAAVRITGSDLLGLHNLDATFYSETCEVVGRLATPAADEAGFLPAGTRFVVVTDRLGIATAVELSVG